MAYKSMFEFNTGERPDPWEDHRAKGSMIYHDYMAKWQQPPMWRAIQFVVGGTLTFLTWPWRAIRAATRAERAFERSRRLLD